MKYFMLICLISSGCLAAPAGKSKILPVTKEEEALRREKLAKEKLKVLEAKAEDCDDKAKKPVEIKVESLSLGGGTAGCTLE